MITKSQRSEVEKKGFSLVCYAFVGFAMQHVAVGCYGQTAKAVMRERVTLHDRLLELCVVAIMLQTQDVDVNESKKRKDKEERSKR